MGLLIDGVWHDKWYDTTRTGGEFIRSDAQFRDVVTADGASGFAAAPGRYHLYVSYACPWAHRTLIGRVLKRLEDVISVSVVDPLMAEEGWTLSEGADPVNDAHRLYEIYRRAAPAYTGRVTVPVLWDRVTGRIVNNESADILRMFNTAFDRWGDAAVDLYPVALRPTIDAVNAWVYDGINNGVYRAGFATTQDKYDAAYAAVFAALDRVEALLAVQPYLAGDRRTEADWRLFTTLVRFDAVYHGHFKCNRQRIVDFPRLWDYVRELYQVPGVAATVHLDHIKRHYYASHVTINPTRIVPQGPDLDFNAPHGRGRS
ncbi:MAG: glutathione S-transferase family protein [Azospirillaceae bacterium]|nr:glutathione S-transferase family protein [Azospirillaceae bacterium]